MTTKAAYDRWYVAHRDEYLAVRRARYAADPTPSRDSQRRYAQANPDKITAKYRRFRAARPDYSGWHYHSTEQRRIGHLVRKALFSALSNNLSRRDWYRNSKLGPLIGCSKPDLVAHIEAQFESGMTWDNHSKDGWEIDHVRPCREFDLTDPQQLAACFHYSNLRPLWRADNLARPRSN